MVYLRLLPLALLTTLAHGISLPQAVADKFGAKCLNGAPPTYELSRNYSSTKWILFLEGGGWCQGDSVNATRTSCAGRGGFVWPKPSVSGAGAAAASTADAQPRPSLSARYGSGADIGGVMSSNATTNPDFHTWNKVFMHYCDGASFGSNRHDPVDVFTHDGKPAQMWMRGRANFDGLISYIQTTIGMGAANTTDVILSGGSAGGLAVFYNLDHLATMLRPNVRLTGFPDAGFFLDARAATADGTPTGAFAYRQHFIGADPLWNVTGSGGTNLKCLAANTGAEWKCLMAQ